MKLKLFFLIFLQISLSSQTLYIIANKNFPQEKITKNEVKAIYLDQKRYIQGNKLLPLNLTLDNPLREIFEKNMLQKSRKHLERYWIKAHYKGHRPPKVLKSKDAMLSFVKCIDRAIGYTDDNLSQQTDIKILLKLDIK